MRHATIFILSDVRSGSTLLDTCLAGHPSIVSLGEVHWLAAYLGQDRSLYDPEHPLVCTCGKRLTECQFWCNVQQSLGRPLDSLQLRQRLNRARREPKLLTAVIHVPRRLVKTVPSLYRCPLIGGVFGGGRVGRDSVALYDAVSMATGRPFCVDSSKSPYRFRDTYNFDPTRTLAIALVRDYRAVVHSKMKRGESLRSAALGWRQKMLQISALTHDLPAERVFQLKYESFCANPQKELCRICTFLGIEFVERMLYRAITDLHHIGGSPSKFDPSRANISLDQSYEGQFTPEALTLIRSLVGKVPEQWGY